MHCVKKISDDLIWVGANDRRLAMFEGVYSVPDGVSYNSYLLIDDKTVLFDTVDKAVRQRFLENLDFALGGRKLDYLIVQHMEPDHSAAITELLQKYPDMKIVCNAKTLEFIQQFHEFNFDIKTRTQIVREGHTLNTGKHNLQFYMAPMVHWPEVMVSYDTESKTLFSADAFGCFGALNGALFADEVDFARDYMDEARRYYTNIVGKYGDQVQTLLNKAGALEINMICPLHGFVWRKNIQSIVSKYSLWSSYEPEETGVMIAYASVYGNTENAAEILACKLRDKGIKTVMFDVSVSPASDIVSASFKWSHLVFASTTYNAGIFVAMEAVINDLVAHNIRNRTAAIIENGSWAATSAYLIQEELKKCRDIKILYPTISLRSGIKKLQMQQIDELADALAASMPGLHAKPANAGTDNTSAVQNSAVASGNVDYQTMFKLSYGLFVLTSKDGNKDNGCIINTAAQVTDKPLRLSITVNKANYTCEMIQKTGVFNVSVLSEKAVFDIFKQFGFSSGRDTDKFASISSSSGIKRAANGVSYIPEYTNGVISGKVTDTIDLGTHLLFIADVTEAFPVSNEPSATYQYYFNNIKPKPQPPKESKKGFVCKICGYIHEGGELPDGFICPLCKHGPEDFERL